MVNTRQHDSNLSRSIESSNRRPIERALVCFQLLTHNSQLSRTEQETISFVIECFWLGLVITYRNIVKNNFMDVIFDEI